MKNEKMASQIEIHVCNHSRDRDEDCARKGSKELTDDLKKWAKENHKGEIKVFRGGCLGKCSEGIAIACYPAREYLLDVKPGDAGEIKEGLKESLQKLKS